MFFCFQFHINVTYILFVILAITDDRYPVNTNISGMVANCRGTERTLQACKRNETESCTTNAGVQCKGIYCVVLYNYGCV